MPEIARSDDLRRNNQRRILHALRRHGPMSRTEISGATGLSASTVTAITAAFLESGVLIEASLPDNAMSRRGRPQVTLTLNPSTACVAALTLSLNRVSAAIVDYAGNVIREIYSRQDKKGAILVFEEESGEAVDAHMKTLPLVKAGLLRYEIYPLLPYRAIAAMANA